MVYKWLDRWHYRLWPGRCLLCDAPAQRALDICRDCAADLPDLTHACRRCALPLPDTATLCGGCAGHPPRFERSIAPLRYAGTATWLIARLKAGNDFAAARILASLMADSVRNGYRDDTLPEALVPMPLHWRRLQQRGYNQATLLARLLGRDFGIAWLDRGIRRHRHVPSQHTLPRRHRYANVRAAFAVDATLNGHHVAIVDDVVTTGASADALALALLQAGAARVDVWCAARTPKPGVTGSPRHH